MVRPMKLYNSPCSFFSSVREHDVFPDNLVGGVLAKGFGSAQPVVRPRVFELESLSTKSQHTPTVSINHAMIDVG